MRGVHSVNLLQTNSEQCVKSSAALICSLIQESRLKRSMKNTWDPWLQWDCYLGDRNKTSYQRFSSRTSKRRNQKFKWPGKRLWRRSWR